MQDVRAKINFNREVQRGYFLMGISTGWDEYTPGQFVMLRPPKGAGLLRMPFSIADSGNGEIRILYKVCGDGTHALSKLGPLDIIEVLGPLGKGFTLHQEKGNLIIIAGGIGIAPFVGMLRRIEGKARDVIFYYGAKDANAAGLHRLVSRDFVRLFIATEDGSVGQKGLITDVFIKDLARPNKLAGPRDPNGNYSCKDLTVFACGPEGLIRSVVDFLNSKGIVGEVSCEAYMGCGIGLCNSCAIAGKDGYLKVCEDGPVFKTDEIRFL